MRLLIIRHGDPDYAIDGLTEVGKIEAELLAERLAKEGVSAIYCSTLGRARATAEPTVKRLGLSAEYCEWLREFDYAKVYRPWEDEYSCAWDVLPEYMATHPDMYHPVDWLGSDLIKDTDIPIRYPEVCKAFDAMLASHGYVREGLSYRAREANHDTVAIFCHYGVTAVLLSHLMNCSPYSLWQHTVTPPTSISVLHTEERREGIAHFRMAALGDTAHLYANGRAPSFSARFCECFTDDTRHD